MAQAAYDGAGADGAVRQVDAQPAHRPPPPRRLGRVPAAREPRADLRAAVLGAHPRRPDAGGPQGAAGRGARVPRARPRHRPRRHPDRRRPRRPRRRRARRRPVPRRRPDGRPRREARRCWASTGGRSWRTSPGSGGSRRARCAGRSGARLAPSRSPGIRWTTAGSDRGSGPGSTRRIRSREGDPDQGRCEARQVGRDEDGGRRVRHQLPDPQPACRARRRRRLSRVPARHRQPRGQAEARARGRRDRRDADRAAPRSRWA